MHNNPKVRRNKLLAEAEGYLALEMYDHALRALDAITDLGKIAYAVHALRAEVLRQKEDFPAAAIAFERALGERPDEVPLLMGVAWCYKRTDRLPQAIEAMQRAYQASPKEAVVLYNLACYWALAGNKAQALSWLGRALRMDQNLRHLIPDEHDFDPLRDDPDFSLIIGDQNSEAPGST
jgi:tetratricopeptide (TPR) repeat protein